MRLLRFLLLLVPFFAFSTATAQTIAKEVLKHKSLDLKGRYYKLYPPENPIGLTMEDLKLDAANTAFLLIDVYGLLESDRRAEGKPVPAYYRTVGSKEHEVILRRILEAKSAARRAGLPIIYLQNYLAPTTNQNTEWRNMSIRTCDVDVLKSWVEPTDILKFSKIMAPEKGDILVKKQMYSGFFQTPLDSALKSLNVRNLVVVGFDGRICLGNTVTDAMYRDYRVIVLRDCTSTSEYPDTKEGGWGHLLAIRFIEANVGYTCMAEDFIKACGKE